jgi:hypothetical protein
LDALLLSFFGEGTAYKNEDHTVALFCTARGGRRGKRHRASRAPDGGSRPSRSRLLRGAALKRMSVGNLSKSHLQDSRHPVVASIKEQLDRGVVPRIFLITLRSWQKHCGEFFQTDCLIAHNVCSLNKNLILTAALKKISEQVRTFADHPLASRPGMDNPAL